jgi:hypothetical protein
MRRSAAAEPEVDTMVLTIGVVIAADIAADFAGVRGAGHTRRRMLGVSAGAALGVTALAGCGIFDDGPDHTPPPDALQPVLDEALALAAAYDRAGVAQPGLAQRLTPLAADHRAHATELARVIGKALPSAPAPGASDGAQAPDTLATLRKAEQAALRTATTAAKQAPAARATLVGSIAACRATHAEALR